jgi:VanZ family protein
MDRGEVCDEGLPLCGPIVDKQNDSMLAETRSGRVYSIAWKVAVVVWALVIFFLSKAAFGLGFTGRLVAGALSFLHLRVPTPSFEVLNHCVRKAAHLAEYAVLAILLCASSKEQPFHWRPWRVLGCFLILMVYSLTDEYHQRFVPGRTASWADCGIDSIGGAIGMGVYYFNYLRLRAICPTVP